MRVLFLTLLMSLAQPAFAQDAETLTDIRAELGQLNGELARLKAELAPSGGTAAAPLSGDSLQRIDAIEAGLTRLNAKAEELENRINRVVTDGTNRIGDIEFRLVELEGGDLGAIGETAPLGGDAVASIAPAQPAETESDAPELAISERNDFERAEGALASGDFRSAAEQFATFTQSYPGSPLEADAHFLRGSALEQAGDTQNAARAYLESFSGSPDSQRAPEALLKLGLSLNALGQKREACLMLQEVVSRFPNSPQATEATNSQATLACS